MYWILFIMAAVAAIVIALVVGGLATPRSHVVARATIIPATPDAVWTSIRDLVQHGFLAFDVTAEDAPHRLVADTLDDNLQVSGNWTWTMQPEGDGTRVTITTRGSIENPVVRFVASLMGHGKVPDRFLHELAARHDARGATIDAANASS